MKAYEKWLAQNLLDPDLTAELSAIEGNEAEINDRFYRELDFGTAGIRGVLGVGTNRMNIHNVMRVTQGVAEYLKTVGFHTSVAIGYDSRIKSELFAKAAASVLAANGVEVHIYSELMPVPALSYAVRELECDVGIMVTASHNPAKYNGYKVYGNDGCQMTLQAADIVMKNINQIDVFTGVRCMDFEDALALGLISYIPETLVQSFISRVLEEQVNEGVCQKAGLKLVYTPLNGAGNRCVQTVLKHIGVTDVTIVPEQEHPDGNFPTCPYPNPEIKEALAYGLKLSKEINADLLLATDPDCDRVGIAVLHKDDYVLLSGNEVGVLLLDYIAKSRINNDTMPLNPITVKSLVSSNLADAIAKEYGIEMINVLTGFKFIGEQILMLEQQGEAYRYIFGFEESYGYLSGVYVRDKDAVNGSMLIVEMASYYKLEGKDLVEALEDIYLRHGVYYSFISNYTFEGADGMVKMNNMMNNMRKEPVKEVAGILVTSTFDYMMPVGRLPKSNVIEYRLENNSTIIVRPSGTEPKIKVYYSLVGKEKAQLEALGEEFAASMSKILGI